MSYIYFKRPTLTFIKFLVKWQEEMILCSLKQCRCLRKEPIRILREEPRGDWQVIEIRQEEAGHC